MGWSEEGSGTDVEGGDAERNTEKSPAATRREITAIAKYGGFLRRRAIFVT